MRRWGIVAVASAAVLVLSGCGQPTAGDRRLIDDWAPLPPALVQPRVGQCHQVTADKVGPSLGPRTATGCEGSHQLETFHVGEFPADVASGGGPPALGGVVGTEAMGACTSAANEYLGGDWHEARVEVWLSFPNAVDWRAGIRAFQCDLIEVATHTGRIKIRSGSLKDGLKGSRPLAIGCANDSGKDENTVDDIEFVACSARHTAEFTGIFTVTPPGRPFPGVDETSDLALDGCEDLAIRYVGGGRGLPRELVWIFWGPNAEEPWEMGNQSFQCYVSVFDRDRPIRGGATLKNLGDKSVPH